MKDTQYSDVKTKKLDGSEYEISATISAELLTYYRKKAIKNLGSDVEVPGFRKGHVPEDMLIGHIGESKVMERAANMALAEVYPKIITEVKIDAIGAPKIQLTKLADGNPLEFTATTAVMPEIKLADYSKIAKKIFSKEETFEVKDEELKETLTHIRRQRSQAESYEQQQKDGVEHPTVPEIKNEDVPELTDEFVQTLGDFKTVKDFEAKVRENILEERKLRDIEKKRIETVEKIIADSKIELPNLLIDQEIARIQTQLEADIAKTGTKLEDYLKNVDKTIEELHIDWKPEAEKRGKLQLILNTISKEQNITPVEEEVQKEIDHVKEHYPDADEENIRVYVESTKRNEMVFKFLENVGE
ncbi:MAG: hypothetical protein JKX80_00300 [Candidatus Pacebacteria bacterium]|nr:hypothetical protein [Candidatus Paceibacterota bacterium]